jgi:hypothetical protein
MLWTTAWYFSGIQDLKAEVEAKLEEPVIDIPELIDEILPELEKNKDLPFDFNFHKDGSFETNWAALDVTKSPPLDYIRRFVRIRDDVIFFCESDLQTDEYSDGDEETPPDDKNIARFNMMTSERGEPVYWTEIDKHSLNWKRDYNNDKEKVKEVTWDRLPDTPYTRGTVIDPVDRLTIKYPTGMTQKDKEKAEDEIRYWYRIKTRKAIETRGRARIWDEIEPGPYGGETENVDALRIGKYFFDERDEENDVWLGTFSGLRIRKEGIEQYNVTTGIWEPIGTGGGSNHVVIDHLPTSADIETFRVNDIVLVYDPTTVYVPTN